MASSPASKWRLRYFHKLPLFPPPSPYGHLFMASLLPPDTPAQPNPTNPQKDRKKEKKLFPLKFRRPSSLPQNGRERDHKQREEDGRTDFFFFLLISSLISPRQYENHPMKSYIKKRYFPSCSNPSVYLTGRNVTLVNPVQVCQCMEKSFPWGYWQVKKKRRRKRDIHTLFFPPAAAHNDCGFLKEKKEIGMSWSDPFSSFTCPFLGWGGKRSVCAMGFCLFGATIFPLLFAAAGRLAQIYLSRKNRTPVGSTHNFLEFRIFFRPTHRRPP